jgi:hypothetical protein
LIRRRISTPAAPTIEEGRGAGLAGSAADTEGEGGEGQRPASAVGLEAARILPCGDRWRRSGSSRWGGADPDPPDAATAPGHCRQTPLLHLAPSLASSPPLLVPRRTDPLRTARRGLLLPRCPSSLGDGVALLPGLRPHAGANYH